MSSPPSSLRRLKTPCIGVCSTVFGDQVCRGCRRFVHEVVHWNSYDEAQKAVVWRRLDALLCQVVGNYFQIRDAALLQQTMEYQNLRYQPQLSPPGWVPELLRALGPLHPDYSRFGLQPLQPDTGTLTARALYDRISLELHQLAQAHYERSQQARRIPLLVETARQEMYRDTEADPDRS